MPRAALIFTLRTRSGANPLLPSLAIMENGHPVRGNFQNWQSYIRGWNDRERAGLARALRSDLIPELTDRTVWTQTAAVWIRHERRSSCMRSSWLATGILLLLSAPLAFAQTNEATLPEGRITGTAINADGEPINQAIVCKIITRPGSSSTNCVPPKPTSVVALKSRTWRWAKSVCVRTSTMLATGTKI
jgi:hypothetical protein